MHLSWERRHRGPPNPQEGRPWQALKVYFHTCKIIVFSNPAINTWAGIFSSVHSIAALCTSKCFLCWWAQLSFQQLFHKWLWKWNVSNNSQKMPWCQNYSNVSAALHMGDSHSPLKCTISLQICILNSDKRAWPSCMLLCWKTKKPSTILFNAAILQGVKIMVFQHANTHTTNQKLLSGKAQMRTMLSEVLPASLSCILHSNTEHIAKCKNPICIDSSWNGTIAFQIYKGNETRRFLRDS